MFGLIQNATRFAKPAVSAWVGHHKIDRNKRFVSEDAALENVCERLVELSTITRIDPAPVIHRKPDGAITVLSDALGIAFMIRFYQGKSR